MILTFLPDMLGMALTELEQMLSCADAVSLDDSYRAAFGVSVADRRVDQKTGDVHGQRRRYGRYAPEALAGTNRAFHRLLISQGMSDETARKYVLVGNYTHAWTRGQILLAVVLRHTRTEPFRVRDKQTSTVTTLHPDQRCWYEAYERDVNGQAIDEVIDWAPLEYGVLRHDKIVATLLVLATEAVKFDTRSPDYWQAERRWLAGETAAVPQESADRIQGTLLRRKRPSGRRAVRRPREAPESSPGAARRRERRSYRSR